MKKTLLFISVIIGIFLCSNCRPKVEKKNTFPLLTEQTQRTIINDLSGAIRELSEASIPIGGDAETVWASSMVDSLHKVVTTMDHPFLQQMTTNFQMNNLFAYGMNYFVSILGLYVCPEEAGYALNAVPICDSLANNVAMSNYEDIVALAEMSGYSYYHTQLFRTIANKVERNDEFRDIDYGFPLKTIRTIELAKMVDRFTQEELQKIYFVLETVCFYKTYCGLICDFATSAEQLEATKETVIEYALYFDEISQPIYDVIYSGGSKDKILTNAEFEEFMIKATAIKVDMMKMLTEEFNIVAKQQNENAN